MVVGDGGGGAREDRVEDEGEGEGEEEEDGEGQEVAGVSTDYALGLGEDSAEVEGVGGRHGR